MTIDNNKIKRWILPKPLNKSELHNCLINFTLQKVLLRRGINIDCELDYFLIPNELPDPVDHFNDLTKASNRIIHACKNNKKIAICGDYDADGITSTVLLVELFSKLGANAIPFIPSRQEDGYGLNVDMVNHIARNDIKLIITVDNGISALTAIKRSNELGIDLIITDHHKITNNAIEVFALIHPEKAPLDSPYKYLAGVGIAYMLARNICNKLNYSINNTTANVLFCIGTVADMAPLIGANRIWLKENLPKFKSTQNIGIKNILKKLELEDTDISTDDIGYKIAPIINAIGRIGEPKLIIDLLTNHNICSVEKLTNECFLLNKQRKIITSLIEKEANDLAINEYAKNYKFIILVKREWHPGVIGIVAARIVDKYNLPTAILSIAKDGLFRGSIRSNKFLKVNLALDECSDLLIAHGGHSDAAGFTIREENIPKFKERLNAIAKREFVNLNLSKSIKPDARIYLRDINFDFYNQLVLLGPFGIKNEEPIFWARKCRILDLYKMKGNHIKMTLDDGTGIISAIKWNFIFDLKVNDLIDIAFHIQINKWKKTNKLQLNIIDIRFYKEEIELKLHTRTYKCKISENNNVIITNDKGASISSNLSTVSSYENMKNKVFAKKILSFAEIALGRAT